MLSSFGAGMVPAIQSVAMCMLHLRADGQDGEPPANKEGAEVGKLFGAFAVLQAIGSMILGVRAPISLPGGGPALTLDVV